MHIDSVHIRHLARPRSAPIPFGSRELIEHETVVVELQSGSLVGRGEANPGTAPTEDGDFAAGEFLCLCQWLAPLVAGQDVSSGAALQQLLAPVVDHHPAKAALDAAWWNLSAQQQGQPLAALCGENAATAASPPVDLDGSLVCGVRSSIEELLEDIAAGLAAGYRAIGLKFRAGWGVEMVRAVRAIHPTLPLWIDCDGQCRLAQRDMFYRLDDFLLTRIEQPLPADDLVGHAMLQQSIRTPIVLDQSITSLERAEQALELESCRQLRIDPQRVGGITPALKIAAECCQARLPALAGMATTPRGLQVAQALAASRHFAGAVDVQCGAGLTLGDGLAAADIARDDSAAERVLAEFSC